MDGDCRKFVITNPDGTKVLTDTFVGKTAIWVAPAVTEYSRASVTCSIDDREGPRVFLPETGSHDDDKRDRTFTALIIPGVSATLSFLKPGSKATATHPDQYVDAGGTIGGTVYATLTLDMGQLTRISSSKATMRVTELEDKVNHVKHLPIVDPVQDPNAAPGTPKRQKGQDHVDLEVDFSNASGWERKYDPDIVVKVEDGVTTVTNGPLLEDWYQAPQPPTQADTTNGAAHYRYRKELSTTSERSETVTLDEKPASSTLLGHNGAHELTLSSANSSTLNHIIYTTSYGGTFAVETPKKVPANVENLVITRADAADNIDTANPDYFRFDAEGSSDGLIHPKITFSIEDKGDAHRYKWYLWIKPTRGEPNSIEVTGILNRTGSKTITLNLDDQAQKDAGYKQDHFLREWGTYTFELQVQEIQNNSELSVEEPLVLLRSPLLSIPDFYQDSNGATHPGHDLQFVMPDDSNDTQVKATYYLKDLPGKPTNETRNSTGTHIDFLDGDQELLVSKPCQPEVNREHKDILIYTLQGKEYGGVFRAIFVGSDNHSDSYRDHSSRRMEPANKKLILRTFHIEDDYMSEPKESGGNSLNPQARNDLIARVFMRTGWQAANASMPKEVANGHFSGSAQYNGDPDYQLEMSSSSYSKTNNGGQILQNYSYPYFDYYYDRNSKSPSDYHFTFSAMNGGGSERYVHVVGAAYFHKPDTLEGLTNSDQRWCFVFVRAIMDHLGMTSVYAARHSIIKTTIHELGHQFGTRDDHANGGDDGVNPAETSIMDQLKSNDPLIYAQGLKALAFFRGRPLRLPVDSPDDYKSCIQNDGIDSNFDYLFCPYHTAIIRGYTGW